MRVNNKNFLMMLVGLWLLSPISVNAANKVCGQDLDGSGAFDGSGETQSCLQVEDTAFCSLGAQDCNNNSVCPLGSQYACQNNTCQKPANSSCSSFNTRITLPLGGGINEWRFKDVQTVGMCRCNGSLSPQACGSSCPVVYSYSPGSWYGDTWLLWGFPIPFVDTCDGNSGAAYAGPYTSACLDVYQYQYSCGGWFCTQNYKLRDITATSSSATANIAVSVPVTDPNQDTTTVAVSSASVSLSGNHNVVQIYGVNYYKGDLISTQTLTNGILYRYRVKRDETNYRCSYNGNVTYSSLSACHSACLESASCSTSYSCPTPGNQCVSHEGRQQCSPNRCIDLDVTPAIETTVASTMAIDNGERATDGACKDEVLLFVGRNSSCRTNGLNTVFKTCCANTDVIYNDSTGGAGSFNTIGAVKNTYNAISAGYAAYQAGSSIAGISSAAGNAFIGGFDPYTIIISLVISSVLEGCNQQDMETSALKASGYCHYVGDYCENEWPLVGCVQKANTYCCFNSKLGRIIQEQGRQQIGKSWGTATSPSCGGLAPKEFQALDFSRIDMSEYYDDIKAKSTPLIQENITNGVENYYRQIQQ